MNRTETAEYVICVDDRTIATAETVSDARDAASELEIVDTSLELVTVCEMHPHEDRLVFWLRLTPTELELVRGGMLVDDPRHSSACLPCGLLASGSRGGRRSCLGDRDDRP